MCRKTLSAVTQRQIWNPKKQYPDLSAVLTGGAAKLIHQVIDFPAQYEPHLSLLGLLRVLELNKHLL